MKFGPHPDRGKWQDLRTQKVKLTYLPELHTNTTLRIRMEKHPWTLKHETPFTWFNVGLCRSTTIRQFYADFP